MDEIKGTVKNIIYRNSENGYTVLELFDETGDEITAVGPLAVASVGERIIISGEWSEHPSYGRQFKAREARTLAPATLVALMGYLGSGLIRGVGEATARDIVATFGMDTLAVMENEPERLQEVPGIGRVRAAKIAESYSLQKDMRDIMLALQEFGITVSQGIKLYKTYGNLCLAKLKENPYRLIDDVEGIGFMTADKLAANAGIGHDSPFRVKAGLKYTLQWARQEGHTCLPREKLIEVAGKLLDIDVAPAERMLDELIIEGELVYKVAQGSDMVFLPYMYYSEFECARLLAALLARGERRTTFDMEDELHFLEARFGITLAPQQHEAVTTAMRSGAMVITGGPGTGKTTILRFIIELAERMKLSYELCAPTGRAAKRMCEATGVEARTIHRMLGYGFEGDKFQRNEDDPLDADIVIVDEMSMVDVPLMHALLRALPGSARLIMVGDADQLPPVGPGNVLRDIIASGAAPVIRLTDIYRQSERGMIVENAHRINNGRPPELYSGKADFRFEELSSPEDIIKRVIGLCSGGTNKLLSRDATRDVQVLVPMKKGALGVINLNARLQAALNPPSRSRREKKFGDTVFREGDKVMQIKNDYKLEWMKQRGEMEAGAGVFNGDLGTIVKVDPLEQTVSVLFDDDRLADYDFSMLDELALAYAATVHKSQGSEFPIVILLLAGGAGMLFTRNLLYTAVTRAREQVYILGRSRCVYEMVDNATVRRRYSALSSFLRFILDGGRPV